MTAEITCILNVFKRFSIFEEQLAAIRSQTIPPKRIIVWNNAPQHHEALMKFASEDLIVVTTSRNMGVWARFFSVYPLLSGQFVCVCDDDTMPASRWFENCVETMKTYNALLGTIGVIFKPGDTYERERRVGWDEPNETAEYADIVGHSWFFKREWISTLMKELPNIDEKYLTCGEDMHLSYTLRKYLHIPTIVPPHPKSNNALWGADNAKSWEYGNVNSTFVSTGIQKFNQAIIDYESRGLEKIRTREGAIRKWSTCLDYFLDKLRKKEPFAIMRYGDGEKYILDDRTIQVGTCDNWKYTSGSKMHKQLLKTLKMTNTNVYYGVSGLSDCPETYKYYYNTILNKSNITYANIFVNQNYPKLVEFLKSFEAGCVLISCNRPETGKIGAVSVIEHVPISDKLVNDWDARCDEYLSIMKTLAARYNRTLFFVSAGPLSEVFIQTMYELNPDNTYVDVGSAIDEFTKGVVTRPYQTSYGSSDVLDLNGAKDDASITNTPDFSGGWSYTQKEMNEFFRHVIFFPSMSILEFGSGDSTIKLYDYFKRHVDNLTFYTYESDPKFMKKHDSIHYVSYDIERMNEVVIPDIQFDIVLIDGPHGDNRSKWYSKIRNNVKAGTIILVDDFNHYKCFSEELDKNFKYELLSHSDEPFVPYGEHSWKIVRVIECI